MPYIYTILSLIASKPTEAQKHCPILAAFLAGFVIPSNYPKKFIISDFKFG
jgi:hypothetical protein